MTTRLANRRVQVLRSTFAVSVMALLMPCAMAQNAASGAPQSNSIPADATVRLAQSREPDTALGRLLLPVDNSAFECGKADGWDAACLKSHYKGRPAQWPRPVIDAGKNWKEMTSVPAVQPPANAREKAKLELGTALFFDAGLSRKGGVSCASCHQAGNSFSDGRAQAVGEDKLMGRRRAQTLFAAPFASHLFWDGRAPSLEEQAKGSITNTFEMNNTLAAAVAHVNAQPQYRQLGRQVWGHSKLSADEMVTAISTFVRTIRPPVTVADAVIAGDAAQLSDQQRLGLHLFRTKARCMNCHSGALLTDNEFHDLGLSNYGRRNQDLGRFEATRNKADLGKFRTPSLRGVSHAGPWMHNGLFADLPGLLRLYNAGMGVVGGDPQKDAYVPTKSEHIKPLNLNAAEIDALVEWLKLL